MEVHDCEIERRMKGAWGRFNRLGQALTDKDISLKQRMNFFDTMTTPVGFVWECDMGHDTAKGKVVGNRLEWRTDRR